MTLVLILIILALIFGVGAVIEGILWVLLIGVVLLAVGLWLGWQKLNEGRRRP